MPIEKNELLTALKAMSRLEWQEVDNAKENTLAPTQEELDDMQEKREADELLKLRNFLLQRYSISLAEEPDKTELANIIRQWFSINGKKLEQFIGGAESIDSKRDMIINYTNDDMTTIADAVRAFLRLLSQYPV